MAQANTNRGRTLGLIALLGLIAIGVLVWWVFFRDTAASSVDSVEAAEARQEAIAEAAEQNDTAQGEDAPASAPAGAESAPAEEDSSTAEVASGQPDAAASVGSPADGLWTVDTSIGTFDGSCLSDVCGAGFVGFRIDEELVGFGAKTVIGRTPAVTGSMEIIGNQVLAAEFVADMSQMITDNDGRTDALRSAAGGLETATFPEASFVLTQPIDLGGPPVEGAAITVNATGNLTVHGVTREVTIPLTAELQAGLVIVVGSLDGMLLSDYDIPTPSAAVVVSVEDNAILELQLFLSR